MLLDIIIGAINTFGWGFKPLLEKKGIEDSSPLIFGNIRYIITAIICVIILTIYKGNKLFTGVSKKTLIYSFFASIIGLISILSNYYLLSKYDANLVIGIVEPGVIVVTVVLGYLFFNEKINMKRIMGILVVCIGIFIIFNSR